MIDTPKEIVERAGCQYLGLQEMPKGRPPMHVFNAPSGSTLMMAEITTETLRAKLAAHVAKSERQTDDRLHDKHQL